MAVSVGKGRSGTWCSSSIKGSTTGRLGYAASPSLMVGEGGLEGAVADAREHRVVGRVREVREAQ